LHGGNFKLMGHKVHALIMFMLQLRTYVDFGLRPWNVWEDVAGLDRMQIVFLLWTESISLRTGATGVHYVNVEINS